MAFIKGKIKTGGRKKGTPNKKTLEFKDALGDFDTVSEAKKLFYSTDKEEIKFGILKMFSEFEYPKRKAVEMSADVDINNEPFEVRFI